jgi:hypothetical protein
MFTFFYFTKCRKEEWGSKKEFPPIEFEIVNTKYKKSAKEIIHTCNVQ